MNILRFTILSLLLLTLITLNAQKPNRVLTFDNDTFTRTIWESSAIDPDGNIYLAAIFNNTASTDIQMGPGVTMVSTEGTRLIKYDRNYNLLWVKYFEQKFILNFSLFETNSIYLSGVFSDSVDFNPDPTKTELRVSKNHDSYFCLELDTSGTFKRMFVLEGQKSSSIANSRLLNLHHLSDKSFVVSFDLEDELDLDPGPGVVLELADATSWAREFNGILLKLDKDFNYIRHQAIRNDTCRFSIFIESDTIYYNSSQTIDWYPSKQDPNLVINKGGPSSLVFLKYDTDLNYLGNINPFWGKDFSSSAIILKGGSGSYFMNLNFSDSISLKLGNSSFAFRSKGLTDGVMVKFKNLQSFEPIAAYHAGEIGYESFFPLGFLHQKDLLIWFTMSSGLMASPSPDFDPGPDTAIVQKNPGYGYGLLRLDENLNFRWVGSFMPDDDIHMIGMHLVNDSTYIQMGRIGTDFSSLDLDLSWGKEVLRGYQNGNRVFFADYTFPNPQIIPVKDSMCRGDSILYRNNYLTEAGIYQTKFLDSTYRDSIIELHLDTMPLYYFSLHEDTLCYGSTITWRGTDYSESGIYYDSLKTVYGCDSVYSAIIPFSKVDTTLKQVNNLLIAAQFQKTYTWVDCYDNYAPIPNITVNAYTPPTGGFYGVILENDFGCVDTSRCVEIRYVGIAGMEAQTEIKVYPNPFTDYITIEGLEIGDDIRVYDALGHELLYTKAPENRQKLDLQNINGAAGLLIIRVTQDGRDSYFKLVRY